VGGKLGEGDQWWDVWENGEEPQKMGRGPAVEGRMSETTRCEKEGGGTPTAVKVNPQFGLLIRQFKTSGAEDVVEKESRKRRWTGEKN